MQSGDIAKPDVDVSDTTVLFYPVTDASFDTESYHQFAEGQMSTSPRATVAVVVVVT